MEVVHAMTGLVRSPWTTVALQVASRVLLVWGYSKPFTACQEHWSLYLMVASWSISEIPRYLFYVFSQFQSAAEIPYVIFYLRYSLFMVLYPTGISGECLQMYAFTQAAGTSDLTWLYFTYATGVLYIFGGPFMVNNMLSNRKSSFKKRKEEIAGKKSK
jgi:very-long-chain (3R)-3-hydroxyacyl-CoA dehydratase